MRNRLLAPLLLGLVSTSPAHAQQTEDAYVAGYVAAVLERELRIQKAVVRVENGVLTLAAADLGGVDAARVTEVLGAVPGVIRVEIGGQVVCEPSDAARPAPVTRARGGVTSADVAHPLGSVLSNTPLLFEPLHADPRWPHFGAAFHGYRGNDGLGNVGTVSFGESFSLYRRPAGDEAQWELGLQAGVFAIFDLDADSSDLVNADYSLGPVAAWRRGPLSVLARVYHQSSHLGDEYLLSTRVNRVNLSYEVADLVVSADVADFARFYGGGGYVLDAEPHLEPWLTQAGAELIGPNLWGGARPFAAADVQSREHHDWDRDVSVRAGLQFEDPTAVSRRAQILVEYYNGRSPNGQFLEQDIEFWGVGLHFYF